MRTPAISPDPRALPCHVAIVMDGNGRWAKMRYLPRTDGHRQGVQAVRQVVQACITHGIPYLTLFVFSTENWNRPKSEVNALMRLLMRALKGEMAHLKKQNICVRVVGNREVFSLTLQQQITATEQGTANGSTLRLTLAINYGGRHELVQAVNRLTTEQPHKAGVYEEKDLQEHLELGDLPPPDLFIRTGGEQRISNFMLWHLAYTELYFSEVLWPDFDSDCFAKALEVYQQRERRFGRTVTTGRVAAG